MNSRNIILTGIPRSGTTLTCHLLNKVPDIVALHEPIPGLPEGHKAACQVIERFFEDTRQSIRNDKTALSKHAGGRVPDNPVAGEYGQSGVRESIASWGKIHIEKELSPDFVLAIKHPASFTALLDRLRKRFPCYAVIRNPLSVLASWNSVSFPVGDGHAPMAERYDGRLARTLARISDKAERQLHLLSWFYSRYQSCLPDRSILRYEEMIATGGKSLAVVAPLAQHLNEDLESKNTNVLYDREVVRVIGGKLLKTDGAFWHFYSRESVERLAEETLVSS